MRKTGSQNIQLRELIIELDKCKKAKLWERISKELQRPSRIRRGVNIYKIDQNTREGETAIIPGTVMSVGELSKNLTIAAWKFTETARNKINQKGKAVSILELLKSNPEGKKVRIIG
ncbi:MAG TPA: 50S ribosomal protein L18e [Candidatus Nanoarchaeia archaeon]|nr:50S ribosomal protein L18e [Candidatus Nanoarchaeia archaeon]